MLSLDLNTTLNACSCQWPVCDSIGAMFFILQVIFRVVPQILIANGSSETANC